MTNLPRSRPTRRSAKRPERPNAASTNGAADLPPKSARAQAKPSAAKAGAGAPSQRAPRRTPRPKPGAAATNAPPREPRRTPRPKPAGVPERAVATDAATRDTTPVDAPPVDAPPRVPPRRKVPAAGYAAPSARSDESASPVHELVTTTVLAASELAQIGLDVGRSAVRSFFDRLPKP